jgi:hypothetical protein
MGPHSAFKIQVRETTLLTLYALKSMLGDKERWKGWQLISITTVERGLLTSLPRSILVPRVPAGNDQSLVVSLDAANPTNIASQQQYMADNSVGISI